MELCSMWCGALLLSLFLLFQAPEDEELRATSGRAGATAGASRASRSPDCGTLCCRSRSGKFQDITDLRITFFKIRGFQEPLAPHHINDPNEITF
jgi:hypothetical protein